MHDSVPPLVTVPAVSADPPSSPATIPTTEFSSVAMLGNTVGSSPLADWNSRCARAASSSRPSRPES